MFPHLLGNTFAVKEHGFPAWHRRLLINTGIAKATYILRDPRDVVISTFERGQQKIAEGKSGSFTDMDSLETAILYVKKELLIWEAWMRYGRMLKVHYEDLLTDPINELARLTDYLSLNVSDQSLADIAAKYDRRNLLNKTQLHFNHGGVGRFRKVMTTSQQQLCQQHFKLFLDKMGYDTS